MKSYLCNRVFTDIIKEKSGVDCVMMDDPACNPFNGTIAPGADYGNTHEHKDNCQSEKRDQNTEIIRQFRQIEGMLKDSMVNNNNAEIPNPIHQTWER